MRQKCKPRVGMKRKVALDVVKRFVAAGEPVHPLIRSDIIDTQMPKPTAPTIHPTFAGWTSQELAAFYAKGIVPERLKA